MSYLFRKVLQQAYELVSRQAEPEAGDGTNEAEPSKKASPSRSSPAKSPSEPVPQTPGSQPTTRKRSLADDASESPSKRFAGSQTSSSVVRDASSKPIVRPNPELTAGSVERSAPESSQELSSGTSPESSRESSFLKFEPSSIDVQDADAPRHQRVLKDRVDKKYRSWPVIVKSTQIRGLMNPGSFCYRNAVLQCLLQQPLVFRYLDLLYCSCDRDDEDEATLTECSVCALRNLFQGYWRLDRTANPSRGLENELSIFNRALLYGRDIPQSHDLLTDFKNGAQSDAYDFLRFVLERCREQSTKEIERIDQDDLFKVEHETEWTCDQCGQTTVVDSGEEEMSQGVGFGVSIDEPRGADLVDYLRQAHTTMHLGRCYSETCRARFGYDINGRNSRSEYVTEGKTRVKRAYFTRLPEILVFRLMLFGWDRENVRQTKIMERVRFQERLNLGEFCRDKDASELYRLDGVVAHVGSGAANSGHYISALRERDEKSFCVVSDDSSITKLRGGTIEELKRPTHWQGSAAITQPYILFYSRIHDDEDA